MKDAFGRWEEVASIDFTYVESGPSDISVQTGLLEGSTVGLARWGLMGRDGLDQVTWGEVTMDTEVTWSPNGGSGTVDFFAVALHEIGHILGLDHVNDASEIMNGSVRTSDLGDGDIAGIRILYGTGEADGGDTTPPDGPDDPDAPDAPDAPPDSGGGGGGGGIGAILGLVALVFGMIFGGFGGGAVALAAGTAPLGDDDPNDDLADQGEHSGEDILLSDLLPEIEVHEHYVYVTEDDWLAAQEHDHDDHDDDFL
jgi:hypothetical protein